MICHSGSPPSSWPLGEQLTHRQREAEERHTEQGRAAWYSCAGWALHNSRSAIHKDKNVNVVPWSQEVRKNHKSMPRSGDRTSWKGSLNHHWSILYGLRY